MRPSLPALILCLAATPLLADEPDIEGAKAQRGAGGWRFDVTLRHPDTGWDHYADAWEVLAPDGAPLGFRKLVHPHVDEQPFTRSLSGVAISTGTQSVTIRARCNVDGWAEETLTLQLPG